MRFKVNLPKSPAQWFSLLSNLFCTVVCIISYAAQGRRRFW